MTWTSLVSSTFFDGVKADMTTAGTGILSLSLIILGIAMLVRTLSR